MTSPSLRPERFDRLDAVRGAALLWMAAFHFCFDLNWFRLWRPLQHFTQDPFWTVQRVCIVSLFLLCAGLGQATAIDAGQGWPRFWRRWGQVAGCALLVSAGSALAFPRSWISFGVLHGMALMWLLVRLGVPALLRRCGDGGDGWRCQALLWSVAGLTWAVPRLWTHPLFDERWLWWTGLVTHPPLTEDYVPLLPWVGVLLAGVAAGLWLLARRRAWLAGPLPRTLQPLALLGRWSLSFYMLHQLVLLGGLQLWLTLSR
jgi:uncharacterized membrane protein